MFLESPPPFGFGLNSTIVSAIYATPVVSTFLLQRQTGGQRLLSKVAVIIGELLGRYLNDWFMNREIRQNNGVFEAETRLWYHYFIWSRKPRRTEAFARTCYVGVSLYVVGLVILGAALQDHLNKAAIIIGWGAAQAGVLVTTVAVCKIISFHASIYKWLVSNISCSIDAYCTDCFPREQVSVIKPNPAALGLAADPISRIPNYCYISHIFF